MDLKLLSWNVRGMRNRDKRVTIHQNIVDVNPNIFCLQETKIQLMSDSMVKDVWGSRPCGWSSLPSWGASGGILLIWDLDKIEVLEQEIGAFSFSIRCRLKREMEDWVFVGVYGPNLRSEVSDFLQEILVGGLS